MHLLKIVILGLLSYATAEIFMSGGFGMKAFTDSVNYGSNSGYGGESVADIRFSLGYMKIPTTDEASSSGFFFDLATDITPQSITVAEVTSGGTTTNFNIDANYTYLLRVGSLYKASKNFFPYIQGVGAYNYDTTLKITGGTNGSSSTDMSSIGVGVGILAFAGERGFYDFNYYYGVGDQKDGSVSSTTFQVTPHQGVFMASIGFVL
ncbi:MAG: hypothetical protein CMF42_02810 [Legionellales bacterium]|nr:hypothetical protein [Legionellales bacterium]OUX67704.1 MAG: hypothetical protein CBD38_01675 [bacterium TMED178]|tara:strand:+ start:1176 stop:1796 length:621 start_codon:yes stop_codon:yes gene_type:complete